MGMGVGDGKRGRMTSSPKGGHHNSFHQDSAINYSLRIRDGGFLSERHGVNDVNRVRMGCHTWGKMYWGEHLMVGDAWTRPYPSFSASIRPQVDSLLQYGPLQYVIRVWQSVHTMFTRSEIHRPFLHCSYTRMTIGMYITPMISYL